MMKHINAGDTVSYTAGCNGTFNSDNGTFTIGGQDAYTAYHRGEYPNYHIDSAKTWVSVSCGESKIKEERRNDMKGLYDVYLCYGENRVAPIIEKANDVLADNDEDAKIKSGLMAKVDKTWDADYLTFIVRKIGELKVKPKPSEVKNV